MMRKFCIVLLCFLLVQSIALAEETSIIDYVLEQGFTPDTSDNIAGVLRCDFKVVNSREYVLTWSDNDHVYTLIGIPDDLFDLYEDLLYMQEWESCSLTIGNRVRATYQANEPAKYECATLDEFCDVESQLMEAVYRPVGTDMSEGTGNPDARLYILNTSTHVFHLPGCSHVDRIEQRNRKEIRNTREYVLERGFTPCGTCNP